MATSPELTPPSIGGTRTNGRANGAGHAAADNSLHGLRGKSHVLPEVGLLVTHIRRTRLELEKHPRLFS